MIRGHWAGVENRNHWRRDALFGEDQSRTRNVNALANLALLRSAVLRLFASFFPSSSTPSIIETLHSNPSRCLSLASNLPR
ncbi:MAG: DDE transposase family protein [Opitutus sp.]|nr:DDE transposase family protein [Opitutus sp.]MCS6277343.1 DDE transposase family protein [Opitutus sp.]MCS6300465.1 DDE transposase family protein [Opitutus sp.]